MLETLSIISDFEIIVLVGFPHAPFVEVKGVYKVVAVLDFRTPRNLDILSGSRHSTRWYEDKAKRPFARL